MAKDKPAPIGTDGKPMTEWQIWLRRLCIIMIVWFVLEVALGVLIVVGGQLIPAESLAQIEGLTGSVDVKSAWSILGISTLAGALLNLVIALLGIRGAKNPCKITLFFWIALIDAVLVAWALASNISNGIIDPGSIVSSLFIIALATCAWQVRKQTGYFDNHP